MKSKVLGLSPTTFFVRDSAHAADGVKQATRWHKLLKNAVAILSRGAAAGFGLNAAHAAPQYFSDAGGPFSWDASTANWGADSGGPYNGLWVSGVDYQNVCAPKTLGPFTAPRR